ncbi:S8 family serine peptidase [Neobacillus sp. WH10]|uniref:S8 family serine peptidase n=1 Tax=Neobacillus sp. WH10 TaxID=3047873 RepID=UPI0024C130DF|nr:S8 family serine peptidase [Neobacillus sp. WH10]WHY76935.1 S8 family serine peptidase [Neobacillus sp. WH10]
MSLKSWKKKKKVTTYVLASALVLSNLGYAAAAQTPSAKKDYASMINQFKQHLKVNDRKKLSETLKAHFKATDNVRIIVEVDGQTPVELATQQGKLYKELAESTKTSMAARLEKQHATVKEKIKAKGVNLKYKNQFTTAFNGFSGEIAFGDIAKLEAVEGVKNVYLANEYKRPVKPDLKTSKSLVQAPETWADAGLKGEGMIVAVIDTGVDPAHKDFVLSDDSKAGLSEEDVEQIVSKDGLKGKYYTEKVPYGYNYFDQNDTIIDKGLDTGMHGMHVAGIVAANGKEEDGGVKGIAPEAQVLAMKVFSNDLLFPSTWSDVYLAAIDDSIKLGADVLNMSLGEVASFYSKDSAEDVAITRATNNGIVCSMSAGNSGTIGYGWGNPFYKNPDIGVVEAPGLNPAGISVAAANNLSTQYQHSVTVGSFNGIGYGTDDWTPLTSENEKLQIVSLNGALGTPEDYEEVDVAQKVVLVKRGDLSLAEKALFAAEAGAAGIIVYDDGSSTFYKNQGGFDIPFMLISQKEGESLETAIATGSASVTINQIEKQQDPDSGKMTEFSSWGTTPGLELKPEITAPGGNILSTLNNDQYGTYSGTSMAAPHVAGGSALVQQYLQKDDRFKGLSISERTRLAKTLLMNTAKVVDDANGQPYSPRFQGAGMMQTYNAVKTPVYVVNKSNGQAKVELKDFTSKKFEMTLTAKNVSTKDVTYNVNTNVLADTLKQNDKGENYNALIAGNLEGVIVDGPSTVTVLAGQTKDITIKVDISKAKVPAIDVNGNKTSVALKEDMFVEGFVKLVDADKNVAGKKEISPDLTVPYVGFYGKWDRPSILDGFKDFGESRFYDLQGMFDGEDEEGNKVEVPVHDMLSDDWFTEPVPEKGFYAISPNGDWTKDDINVFPSFLRNAAEAQFNILDENKQLLRRVKLEKNVFKSYFDDGNGMPFSYNYDRTWDGTVKGKSVKDGLYYYQVKTVIDYKGAGYQTKDIPILVDTVAPQVTASFDPETSFVSWDTVEEGSGVLSYGIFVNGEFVGETTGKENSYELTDVPEGSIIDVLAADYAYNFGGDTAAVGEVEDGEPVIIIDPFSTMPYGAYNAKAVPVTGMVIEDLGLKSLTVNGKAVSFTHAGPGMYAFSTNVTFAKDGFYDIIVKAVDQSDNSSSIARKVFVDSSVPQINVTAPKLVAENKEEVTLKLNLKDNFNYLSLFVNDNHEYEKAIVGPVDVLTPANDNVEVKVAINRGENKISLKLRDLAGNETVKEVVINRANVTGWKQEDGSWYYYNNSIKATGWLKGGNTWYFLDKDGKMQTGWFKDKNKWYFLTKSGAMAENQWVLDHNKWYYLGKDGVMQTGWIHLSGKWYYLNAKGEMATGWVLLNGKWYYLNASGDMATGWKQIGGKWYYLYTSGQLAVNTTINGYKVNKDGTWVK